jgi:solute carrier family 35 protein C2
MSKRIKDKVAAIESPELQSIDIKKIAKIDVSLPAIEGSRPSSAPTSEKQLKRVFFIGALSLVVVTSSIAVTIYQSLLLSEDHYYFPFPLLSAAYMNIMQMLIAVVIVSVYGRLFRTFQLLISPDGLKATYQAILPCSVVTATELAISFMALRFVSVAFYTMVRSSAIIFILFGAFITGRERVNVTLIAVILFTGAGVILAAWDPSSTAGLNALGFGLSLAASMLSGVKWVLTEVLLNENESFMKILKELNQSVKPNGKPRNLTPLLTILLLAPLSTVTLAIGAVVLEGFPFTFAEFTQTVSWEYALITAGNMSLISILVFLIRVSDFRLVQLVNLITFSLLGIVKEILMISISVLFLGEVLFAVNWIGLVMTIVGVALYSHYRHYADLKSKNPQDIELTPVQRKPRKLTMQHCK